MHDVDFFSLDVEQYEVVALASLNLTTIDVSVLLIEVRHESVPRMLRCAARAQWRSRAL